MKQVFQRRRSLFRDQCLRYLRYVLNDHFVLVLMVFIGFLALQYRELLLHFPSNPWGIVLFLVVYTVLLLLAGRIATYVEAADSQFLLAKEAAVREEIGAATKRSVLLWGIIQLLGQVLVLPIYLKLGLTLPLFLLALVLLTMGKVWVFQRRMRHFTSQGLLDWDSLISKEQGREQSILQFFALFTRVKGITTSVKPRRYLDGLLGRSTKQIQTWDFLYLRAFVRSGDFLGLTVRLLVLSLAFLIFVEVPWLAAGLAVLFDYLLLFQLLGLYQVYSYQYMTRLYPVSLGNRRAGFLRVIRKVVSLVGLVQLLVALVFLTDKLYVLLILGGIVVLLQMYLPVKTEKVIDETSEN